MPLTCPVMVAQLPPVLYCWLVEKMSNTVAIRRGCTRMRRCTGNGHSPGETHDAWKVGVSWAEMRCPEDSAYIKPDSVVESPVYVWSVTGSLLFGSPLGRVRGLPTQDPTWIVLVGFWFHGCFVWWIIMLSDMDSLAVNQAGAAATASTPLPGTCLGLALDLRSDRLYDLVDDIPDVMGLRALRPSATICKVMSVPDSRCIRVVTSDDHVSIGFHEILIHDLADEEWPLVTLSDLGCLRLDWPKPLFTFMSRYQFDLDPMRKECRERFGSTQSGTCTTYGKHIQINLGKHIALYHMELAQLWCCPVAWCTVWKGTAQDYVDHMRRAHDIPPLVKAANLTRWFPP